MPESQHDRLRSSFIGAGLPNELVDSLLLEYVENKRRYYLSDYSPAAINGGRFCEVVTRIMQHLGGGTYTGLSDNLKVEQVLNQVENFMTLDDGLRLHATRAIRLIYGVRNSRNTGHLRGDIDPNLQDATLVIRALDWILAELVRVAHDVPPEVASDMISNIVSREVPLIEEIDGQPVVLDQLSRRDLILVLLYWAGGSAVPRSDLRKWLPEKVRKYSAALTGELEGDRLVYISGDSIYLTRLGIRYVESGNLLRAI